MMGGLRGRVVDNNGPKDGGNWFPVASVVTGAYPGQDTHSFIGERGCILILSFLETPAL